MVEFNPTRRRFVAMVGGAAGVAALSGKAWADHPSTVVRIGGTGTSLGGMKVLGAAFSKIHPEVAVVVLPSLGSGGGIKACVAGKIDIAVSARAPKAKETVEGLKSAPYGRTPIVFATRYDNPVTQVSFADLYDIYSGTRTSWRLGAPIRLIMRPEDESDTKLLRGISGEMDRVVPVAMQRDDVYVAMNDQDNAEALETVPGSFGMTTLTQSLTEKRRLNLLNLDGRQGTLQAVADGSYPYAKALHFVALSRRQEAAQAFLEFVASAHGQQVLEQVGILSDDMSAVLNGET